MATVSPTAGEPEFDISRDRLVIAASSLGTVFEWYDFFVYGTLAALLGRMFFEVESATFAFLLSLATFAVGFLMRPVGAVLFGFLGDRIGRKYTFLITITVMGLATASVGFLPTYAQIGLWAPGMLVTLRLLQGLALGGEYGGAAIYVAEHAPSDKRGLYTGWIQMSVVGGFLLSLLVVISTNEAVGEAAFAEWGWRVPFILSLLLLALSLYIRLKLNETPVYRAMKNAGRLASNPLIESFRTWSNIKLMIVALFGIAAGLTVIWYNAQFYTLYFLQGTAKVDENSARMLIGLGSLISAPGFIFFGWLSDRIGRRPVMVAGYALTLILLFPMFWLISSAANPELSAAMERNPVTISVTQDCNYSALADTQSSDCARTLEWFAKNGIDYSKADGVVGAVTVSFGGQTVQGFDPDAFQAAVDAAGYPRSSNAETWRPGLIVLAVVILGLLSGMTYGPVAAILVELFPARIRYTSLSIPYHIGTGVFGGMLPVASQYIVVSNGAVFGGLWYTWVIVAVALFVTFFFLPETNGRDIGG
jgi:MFS family permease